MSPLIHCDRLVKIYRIGASEVVALQGLELCVQHGEMVGVVGVSGSGKSTLLNILGGLTTPTAGRVEVEGIDLSNLGPAELARYRRNHVGFVWQRSAANLLPHLSAIDNVGVPLTIGRRLTKSARRTRALELLELVGLTDRAGHKPVQLSGGEQQRVSIAVALAAQPTLLLADEPTGELDSETANSIYELLREINVELGLTQLIVSHDPAIVSRVDRVVAVSDGQLARETRALPPSAGPGSSHRHDEVLLVDGQGRVQLPQDAIDELGIKARVRAEVVDGSLRLTRPDPSEHHGPEREELGND